MAISYTRETELGTWEIQEDLQRNWIVLKLKRRGGRWRVINIFYTIAGAACAVGCGESGEPSWDALPHEEADFLLVHWQPVASGAERVSAA